MVTVSKPDLAVFYLQVEAAIVSVDALGDVNEGAYQAALGEWDDVTERDVPGTASGDDAETYEAVKQQLGAARVALLDVKREIERQEGARRLCGAS